MEQFRDDLERGLARLEVDTTARQVDALLSYLRLLQKWNAVYNLTAIRDPASWVTLHVLDSLAILPFVKGPRVIDVGTGAGLPGIPVAVVRPDLSVTLVDSNQKKSAFVAAVIGELGLGNACIERGRIESLSREAGFETVVSRAFADLADFIRLAGDLMVPGGQMLAMKGLYPDDEILKIPSGYVCRAVHALAVPELTAARHLVVLEKS